MEAILSIWKRDIIKSIRDKASLIGNLALPILLLIIFGSGMGGVIKSMANGVSFNDASIDFNFIKFINYDYQDKKMNLANFTFINN